MIKKSVVEELAQKAIMSGNPYKQKAVQFYVDMRPMYLYVGCRMTEAEIDAEYIKTAKKDIENGYKERMVGYYDKWYRYNRADEGRAYDLGVRYAADQPKCSAEFNIIPCIY